MRGKRKGILDPAIVPLDLALEVPLFGQVNGCGAHSAMFCIRDLAFHELLSGGGRSAVGAGKPERLDLAALREGQRGEHRVGKQLNLSAHEIGKRRRSPLVGNHQRVEAGLALEKLVFARIENFTVVRWGMMT